MHRTWRREEEEEGERLLITPAVVESFSLSAVANMLCGNEVKKSGVRFFRLLKKSVIFSYTTM